jgi:catechol 2,3-dioxygenase-like lactoylglutathione lyase family enzyme
MTTPPSTSAVPALNGIIETALYVRDLATAVEFYTGLFGFKVMLRDDRIAALRVREGQVLLLFVVGKSSQGSHIPGGFIPPHDAQGQIHMGIGIPADALDAWIERLGAREIAIESRVRGPFGGTSIYFRDPDGHALELLTPGIWENY